jgi:hypothetical protein
MASGSVKLQRKITLVLNEEEARFIGSTIQIKTNQHINETDEDTKCRNSIASVLNRCLKAEL